MKHRLYSHRTGPLVQYDGEVLYIEDLNPHLKTRWRMSRWEMIKFGLKAILAAFFGKCEA